MLKIELRGIVCVLVVLYAAAGAGQRARAQAYTTMAPLEQYLMSETDEIALAKSAAPAAIADNADVVVLRKDGYTAAVKGTNGFMCIVERSWAKATDDKEFWNAKMRGPICFNAAAARTIVPIYLMKTKLVLEGHSRAEILAAVNKAFDAKQLPTLDPGAMCYMLSKRQYLSDGDKQWHPHLMFYAAGDEEKSWGANVVGSPVIAANDPEERVTIFMVWVGRWSDGSPAPSIKVGMEH